MFTKVKKYLIVLLAATVLAVFAALSVIWFAPENKNTAYAAETDAYMIYWGRSGSHLVISYEEVSGANERGEFRYDDVFTSGNEQWLENQGKPAIAAIESVRIINVSPVSTAYWFYGLSSLTSVTFDDGFTADNLMNMSNMFNGCSSLTTLDMSKFNFSGEVDTTDLFTGCDALKEITLSGSLAEKSDANSGIFETSDGQNRTWYKDNQEYSAENLFNGAGTYYTTRQIYWGIENDGSRLTISDTQSAGGVGGNFDYNSVFTTFNTAPWAVQAYRTSIKEAVVTGSVAPVSVAYWFYGCTNLSSLDLSGLSADGITGFRYMFQGCDSLSVITVNDRLAQRLYGTMDNTYLYNGNHSVWYGQNQQYTDENRFNTAGTYTTTRKIYWSVEAEKLTINGSGIADTAEYSGSFEYNSTEDVPWADYAAAVTEVDLAGVAPVSTANWFNGFGNLTELDLSGLSTVNVTDMSGMFNGCGNLTSLDLSVFDTAGVTDMSGMFNGCANLTYLDLEKWDTAKVENVSGMFGGCDALSTIKVPDDLAAALYGSNDTSLFELSDGTYRTWYGKDNSYTREAPFGIGGEYTTTVHIYWYVTANKLTLNSFVAGTPDDSGSFAFSTKFSEAPWGSHSNSITTAEINAIAPESTAYWFSGLNKLESVTFGDGFIATYITEMTNMFEGCGALNSVTVGDSMAVKLAENGDTYLYDGNHAVWQGDYRPYTAEEPFSAGGTYITTQKIYWCVEDGKLTLNVTGASETATERGGFVYDKAFTDSANVPWASCAATVSAVALDNVSPVSTAYWFNGFSNLTEIDLSGLNTAAVTDMRGMFGGCSGLETIIFGENFDTSIVFNMSDMFNGCRNLTELDLSALITENVTDMSGMFGGCAGFTSLDLTAFSVSGSTNVNNMFQGCGALKEITLSDSLAEALNTVSASGLYEGNHAAWYDNDGPAYTEDNHLTKGGAYTVVQPPFSVSANGALTTYHDTFDKAWAQANSLTSATITINAEAQSDATLEVAAGKSITIISEGYTLYAAGINVSGALTIGSGIIEGEIYVASGGRLNISGAPVITVDTEIQQSINVSGELTDGAQVTIKSTGAVVIGFTQSDDPSEYFIIADPETNNCISVKDGTVTITTHGVGGINVAEVKAKTYKAFDKFDSDTITVKTYCEHCGAELDTLTFGGNGYGVTYPSASELHVGDEYLTVYYSGYNVQVPVTVIPVDLDIEWQYSANASDNWGEIPSNLIYNALGEGLRANFRAKITDPNGVEHTYGMQNSAYALVALDGETFTYTGAIKDARTYTLKLNADAQDLKDFNLGNNSATVTIAPFEIELGDVNNFHWILPEYGSELRDGYIETLTDESGAVMGYKYHSERDGNYTEVVRSVVRDRGRDVTIALQGLRSTQNNPDGVYDIEYVEDSEFTVRQSAVGKYTAKAVLSFTDAADGNYVFVNKIAFAANRHMTATDNGDGTFTITKIWYIAQIDNGLLSQNGDTYGQEYSISGWAFGEDVERYAPRLEHGDAGEYNGTYVFAQDDNKVTFTLYIRTSNSQGQIEITQIGSTFNRYDFSKYINKTMPAGVYELHASVAALDAEAGHTHWYDGTEHTDENLHYAAFTRTFTFEVSLGEITSNLNDGLKGKTFEYTYDGTLKLYGDAFTLTVEMPERGSAEDNEWAKAEYDNYYASGELELTYRLRRWSGAPEYQSAQQLANRAPDQSPVNADTYIVFYRLSVLNYNVVSGEEEFFTVAIAKAGVAKPDDIQGGTYDGTEKTADVAETERYTVEGSLTFINAGKHEITLRLKDNTNYAWLEDGELSDSPETTIRFIIDKIGVEKPENQEHTYDGTEFTYIVASGVRYTITGTFTYTNANEEGHDITLTLNDSQNYAWIEGDGLADGATTTVKLIIKKADYYNDLEGVTFEGATFTYDGTAHEIAISGQLPEGVYVSYKQNGQINAGEYTVTAEFLLDETLSENYNSCITPKQATLKINKAKVTVPQDVTQTIKDGSFTFETEESALYEVVGDATFTEAGTYEITLQLKDADNYEWAAEDGSAVEGTQVKIALTLNVSGGKGNSNMIFIIAGIAGGVLVLGIIVIVAVSKSRKKKSRK